MSDVTLTAAVRQNLLALQSTADLIARTQNRLSTGLRVSSALDDAVAYFQAKGLTDRSIDFEEKKAGIDQGISTLTAATDAVTGVQALVQQLKGLATNAKSATTDTEIDNIVSQFNIFSNNGAGMYCFAVLFFRMKHMNNINKTKSWIINPYQCFILSINFKTIIC